MVDGKEETLKCVAFNSAFNSAFKPFNSAFLHDKILVLFRVALPK